MKKLLIVIFLILFTILFLNCKVNTDAGDAGNASEYQVIGKYLKVESTGLFFNELTNNTSTETVTIDTIINLFDEPTSDGRGMNQGNFGSGGGGVTFSGSNGLNPNVPGCDGTAHVNGFISKGPFEQGSGVKISLLDEDFNEIPIATEFLSQLNSETSDNSSYTLNLSATEDIDIPINVNILTALQSARVDALVEKGLGYGDAYARSKGEVLSVFELDSESQSLDEFEDTNLTDNTSTGSALLIASAVVLNDNTGGRSATDFINGITDDIAENGTLTDETLADTIAENKQNTDFTTIASNLQNHYQEMGETVDIPETNDYEDEDGDGISNLYDLNPVSPLGFVADPTTIQWEYNGSLSAPKYALQISENSEFVESQTTEVLDLSGTSYTITQTLNQNQTYYWRVAIYSGDYPEDWSASTSFTTASSTKSKSLTSNPYGEFLIEGGISSSTTRVVTINNSNVIGATQMRFSNDGTFDTGKEDWVTFELEKRWILTGGLGDKTVYAEFLNTNGTTAMSKTISYDNTSLPSGTFTINNGASQTTNRDVVLNLTGISNAFKMRFTNDDTFDSTEEAWVDFSAQYNWTLSEGLGSKTITGEFKNSQGTHEDGSITATIELITLATEPTGEFTVTNSSLTSDNVTVSLDLTQIVGADEMYFSEMGTAPASDNDYVTYSNSYAYTFPNTTQPTEITGYFKNAQGTAIKTASVSYYTLTVNSASYGTVSVLPDLPYYKAGTEVILTPTPDAGYEVSNWAGATVTDNGNGTYSVIINSDTTITPSFAPITYQLTVQAGTGGTVSIPVSSPVTVNYGVATSIEATPDTGYEFVNWTIVSGSGASFGDANLANTTVTLTDGDATIEANFAPITYQLTVQVGTGGTISMPASSPVTVNYGVATSIEATPDTGYEFVNWTIVSGSGVAFGDANLASTTVTLTASDATIQANFTPIQYQLTVQAGANGTISIPASSPVTVDHGVATNIEAAPDLSFFFIDWTVVSGSGVSFGDPSSASTTVTLTNGDATIEASFAGPATFESSIDIATAGYAFSEVMSDGTYAYVATDQGGLQVIDVTNPAVLTEAGSYDTSTYAYGIYIYNNHAYIGDAGGGLYIIDISNPTSPTFTANYTTPTYIEDSFVYGNYAYVAAENSGLKILDISTPSSPSEVGGYVTSGLRNVHFDGTTYAYLADSTDGLIILDVSTPSSPSPVGSDNTNATNSLGIYLVGTTLYLADGTNGLHIYDVSTPSSPSLLGTHPSGGVAYDVYVVGNYAYLADNAGGFVIVDVSEPTTPTEVYSYDTGGDCRGVHVYGDYAYAADRTNGLFVFNVAPLTP